MRVIDVEYCGMARYGSAPTPRQNLVDPATTGDREATPPGVGWCGCAACSSGTGSIGGKDSFVAAGTGWSDNGGTSSGSVSTLTGPGGVVTWSVAGPGIADDTGIGFFNGATVGFGSFLNYDYEAVLRQAFAAWSHVANIQFIQVEDTGEAIGVGINATIRIAAGAIDGPSSLLAQAFYPASAPCGGDVVFDTADATLFATQQHFFLVAAHEIGHALGLNHEETKVALMNPYFNAALSGLTYDDINGIRAVYGIQDFGPSNYYMPDGQTQLTIVDDPSLTRVHGNGGNNSITGNAGANQLYGRAGNDVLRGMAGDDRLAGGLGTDTLDGGAGTDIAVYDDQAWGNLVVSLKNPALNTGEPAKDNLVSIEGLALGDGNDRLYGNDAANVLAGGGGNDMIWGSGGADRIDGGRGYDYARYDETGAVGVRADLANRVAGTGVAAGDTFVGVEGLALTGGADVGYGDARGNTLLGLGGNDLLNGRDGNGTLNGGAGADRLVGGGGNDTFSMRFGYGRDTVVDFTAGPGVGDRIDLRGAFNYFAEVSAAAVQVGANTEIRLNANDVLLLQNVQKSNLMADDVLV